MSSRYDRRRPRHDAILQLLGASTLTETGDRDSTVIVLRITGNALLRILDAAAARARTLDDAALGRLIDAARDCLAAQRCRGEPDAPFMSAAAAHIADTSLADMLCRVRDVCRLHQDALAAAADSSGPEAEGWRAIARRLEELSVAAEALD